MDPLERLLAERACERLVIDFVHRLDLGDPSSVAELFTEDGWWQWPPPGDGRRVAGRQAIAAYFGSRPPDRLSRRVMSNILIAVGGSDEDADADAATAMATATGTSYFQTYRVDGYAGEMVPAGAPVQVGHYEDVFRRVAGRWLLASRSLVLPFGGATPRAGR
ncbi:nuclear transport factor 2 family protein [Streptomyces sp. NPDC013172]|uniref:nuclear transport factor 2 family protein n=1 Tax=Streptomyces sp. NPDC013172 TaxID=3155009 RepID=UPI0033FE93CE